MQPTIMSAIKPTLDSIEKDGNLTIEASVCKVSDNYRQPHVWVPAWREGAGSIESCSFCGRERAVRKFTSVPSDLLDS